MIKTQEDFFNKICTPHFICNVWKGYSRFSCERELGTEQKLQYFDPHSYGRERCVFLVLLMLNRKPRDPLCWVMAFFTASYQHLLWTPTHKGSNGPFGLLRLFLPHLVYKSARSLTGTHQGPKGPFGLMWLYLPQLVYLRPRSNWNSLEFCLDWVI